MPGFEAVRDAAAAAGLEAYLVGGAVRDALLGIARADLDLVVVGDHLALARALGEEIREHDRFDTATVATGEGTVDIARARAESYPHPGALPEVRPAGPRRGPLRVATSASMRWRSPLGAPDALIDPHGGSRRPRRGRAARAARRFTRRRPDAGAARRPLRRAARARAWSRGPWPRSARRTWARSRPTASRPSGAGSRPRRSPAAAFELLDEWGLIALPPGGGELIARVVDLAQQEPWKGEVQDAEGAILLAAGGEIERPSVAAATQPAKRSEAVAAAQGLSQAELAGGARPGGGVARRLHRGRPPRQPLDLRTGPGRRRHRTGARDRPRPRRGVPGPARRRGDQPASSSSRWRSRTARQAQA